MGYEVKLPGKQTLKARIVGIYGSSINGGTVLYDAIKLQKAANGFGMVYKNHSETSDSGVQVTDYAANGDYLALQVRANQQELNLLASVGGTTGKRTVLHSGNIGSYAAPAKYGLNNDFKTTANAADVNGYLTNGWYKYLNDAGITLVPGFVVYYALCRVDSYSTSYVVQTLYPRAYSGCSLQRYYSSGVWSEWEWVNPPLATNVEYRTTERYKGSAVYKKIDTNGNVLWRRDGESQWHLLSSADYIATATVE